MDDVTVLGSLYLMRKYGKEMEGLLDKIGDSVIGIRFVCKDIRQGHLFFILKFKNTWNIADGK